MDLALPRIYEKMQGQVEALDLRWPRKPPNSQISRLLPSELYSDFMYACSYISHPSASGRKLFWPFEEGVRLSD